jgi:AraC-like DNA-binding protein
MSTPIRAVILAAESLGASRVRLLSVVGMRWEDLERLDVRVSHAASAALWDEIAAWSGDPLIGVRIGRAIAGTGMVGLWEYTVRSAPTIADAWARLSPLIGLLFGDGYELVTRTADDRWELGYRLLVSGQLPIPLSEEALVTGFVHQCRAVSPAFAPEAVCFQHATGAPLADYRRELGCPVELGASFYGVRLGERSYRSPIPGHDPSLAGLIETLARPLVAAPTAAPGPADPAIRVIRDLLDRGEPVTVDAVASALHMSRRTLQRQLAAASTSVRAELERARRDAALAMLRDGRSTIAEIATRLGFADASQFTRAVRRWTGEAPTALRRR